VAQLEGGSGWSVWRAILIAAIALVVLAGAVFAAVAGLGAMARSSPFAGGGKDKIAIVEMEGRLTSSEHVVELLKKCVDDSSVKGVVLRVESPGGDVAAAQEIYQEVGRVREAGKKVVASMGSVAASGGYYIACAADRIVANPGSITGSIGVYLALPNVEQLMDKVGLGTVVIKSGEHKDIGSPVRSITKQEREILQRLIDDVHGQFVEAVASGRGLPRDRVLELSDGSVFSGRQALDLGLVDELGDMEHAVQVAARLADILGKPSVVRERRMKGFLRRLFEGDLFDSLVPGAVRGGPTFQYLWRY